MSTPENLEDLYTDELKDLWSANDQMQRCLKKITSKVSDPALKEMLTKSVEGMVEVWTAGKAGYGIAKGIGNMLLWLGKVLVAVAVAWAAFKGWLRGLV